MGLIKKNSDRAAAAPVPEKGATLSGAAGKFEDEPGGDTAVVDTPTASAPAAAPAPAPAAAPQPSESRAVAAPKQTAVVAAPSLQLMDVIEAAKNAYRVDWDTLDRVQANNGKFLDVGKQKANMGETIQLRLLSWQDLWQISPGVSGAEAAEYVRYSDDGKITNKGEDCIEFLNMLKNELGYKNAKLTQRVVIVGILEGTEKDSRLQGEMVQIDLSNTSKKEFDKYRLGCAYKVGKGILTAEQVSLMTMKTEIATKGTDSWTKVLFEPTILPEA